jgi:hypothetical protein
MNQQQEKMEERFRDKCGNFGGTYLFENALEFFSAELKELKMEIDKEEANIDTEPAYKYGFDFAKSQAIALINKRIEK